MSRTEHVKKSARRLGSASPSRHQSDRTALRTLLGRGAFDDAMDFGVTPVHRPNPVSRD